MSKFNVFSRTIFLLLILVNLSILSTQATAATLKNDISYTDTGSGKPLVLIHAFPTDQRLWKSQQDQLKKYFRVITLDLWGFGKSATADGNAITMKKYADEVKQLLDELHIQHAIIGGESMGGYIALAMLQHHPDYVSGLILSDTQSIADSDETKIKREKLALDVLEHGSTQLIDDFMTKALTPEASVKKRTYLRRILESQTATGIASALRGMALRSDTSDVLATTQVPTLIITGDKDALISPQQSENMHHLAKNSKLISITNAGHLSSLEQPEQWNEVIIDMFS